MPPEIAAAEWVVMQVVWDADGPVLASDVIDAVTRTNRWSPATVKTLLNRLLKKGVLEHESDGRRYRYHAAVTREACRRDESRSFVDRVFGGEGSAVLSHFVRHTPLTKGQIAELKAMLDEKRSTPKRKGRS